MFHGMKVSRFRLARLKKADRRFRQDFVEIQLLGKGGFGLVYECNHKLDGSNYAVKLIPFKAKDYAKVLREVTILAALQHPLLQHPGVIRYFQCWVGNGVAEFGSASSGDSGWDELIAKSTKTLFVIMELCPSTMNSKVKNNLPLEVVMRYLKEMLEALAHIHGIGLIHGDISRDNIFLDANDKVKIADFGLARFSDAKFSLGNPMYQAPELSDPSAVSTKADMYALGLVLFEMSFHMDTVIERSRAFEELKDNPASAVGKVNLIVGPIIQALLKKDPQARPSAAELLNLHFP